MRKRSGSHVTVVFLKEALLALEVYLRMGTRYITFKQSTENPMAEANCEESTRGHILNWAYAGIMIATDMTVAKMRAAILNDNTGAGAR